MAEIKEEDWFIPPEKYEYLDHTADVQLHAWGDTLKEAFEQCANAMFGYITSIEYVEMKDTLDIEAEGHDLDSLLFHFLDEFLFNFCAEPFFIAREAASAVQDAFPGSRGLIRQAFSSRGIDPATGEVMMAAIQPSTVTSYAPAFKRWWRFCLTNNGNLFQPTRNQLLQFFTAEFNSGLAYRSVNCSRAAISLLTNAAFSDDSLVKRFFRGCASLRPPAPKYQATWDPQQVLQHLKALPNAELSLAGLSQKLLMLLALATGHRLQTFASIILDNISENREAVVIKVPARIKTSAVGRCQPVLTLPFYPESAICPAATLLEYLRRTKAMRGPVRHLFIALKPPARPVGQQTLARWVRYTLSASGIDPSFSAHSTRHAATSAARRGGASLTSIFRSAGWTPSSSAFARFYDRPLADSTAEFANAVFQMTQ